MKASDQAFTFGRGDRCLSGTADGVSVSPQATGRRSPIKAVAKCARHCHLTVTLRPHSPRAFVYHGSRRGSRREPGPGGQSPGNCGGRSLHLPSPSSYHSRTRFLNLVPHFPAPKSCFIPLRIVNAVGIGRLGSLAGRERRSEFRASIGGRLVARWSGPAVLPRPLEGDLEDARGRAPSTLPQLRPERSRRQRRRARARPSARKYTSSRPERPVAPVSPSEPRGFCQPLGPVLCPQGTAAAALPRGP